MPGLQRGRWLLSLRLNRVWILAESSRVFAFQVITTVLYAVALFFVFKGYKVEADDGNFTATKVKATRNQLIALLFSCNYARHGNGL